MAYLTRFVITSILVLSFWTIALADFTKEEIQKSYQLAKKYVDQRVDKPYAVIKVIQNVDNKKEEITYIIYTDSAQGLKHWIINVSKKVGV